MFDMFGRRVDVGDVIIFYGGWRMELMRVTKFNEKTNKISVEPVDKQGNKTGPGKSSPYGREKLFLVRDIDLITS